MICKCVVYRLLSMGGAGKLLDTIDGVCVAHWCNGCTRRERLWRGRRWEAGELMTKATLSLFVFVLAIGLLSACGSEICSDGNCQCPASESCDFECTDGGCSQQCDGDCDASCEAGGCSQQCALGATCNFTCAGGNCTQSCVRSTDCTATCSGGGCTSDTDL